MSEKRIDIKDLLKYEGKEGLILQGCGGDPQEWIDGINEHLTKQEILLDGTKFEAENCAVSTMQPEKALGRAANQQKRKSPPQIKTKIIRHQAELWSGYRSRVRNIIATQDVAI